MAQTASLVFSPDADRTATAAHACTNAKLRKSVVDALAGEGRRSRQVAAAVVHEIASAQPALLKPYAPQLADALHRPESQTRWEVLGTFEMLVPVDAPAPHPLRRPERSVLPPAPARVRRRRRHIGSC